MSFNIFFSNMHHFFVKKENIFNKEIYINGDDYFHAVNVLRLTKGEKVLLSEPTGIDYICSVKDFPVASPNSPDKKSLRLKIEEICESNNELLSKVTLFQCLPKSGNMELIIQKAVELGVSEIVPVSSKNCVVKLDEKSAFSKLKRWQLVAKAASEQSNRSIIPVIRPVMNFPDAVKYCEKMDVRLIPYEEEKGLKGTCEAIISILPEKSIGVFIGPEGGFDPLEISMAKRHGILPISLGKRILRTETASIAALSLIMIRLEIATETL